VSLRHHAERELDLIGMAKDGDEMNVAMRNHILHMVDEFADEGHSGSSASYALGLLEKLLAFEPLSPLTGDEHEWNEVGADLFQNNRCSHIFKDSKGGRAYDINGIVFYDMVNDDEGKEYQSCYTTQPNSRVWIDFPCYPPKPIYKLRPA